MVMASVMPTTTKNCFVADSDLRSTVAVGGMVNAAQDLRI